MSQMSDHEDEHNETFGLSDRLQSIFTMNKKEGDQHQERTTRGGQLIIRGSSKGIIASILKPNY